MLNDRKIKNVQLFQSLLGVCVYGDTCTKLPAADWPSKIQKTGPVIK